MQSPSKPRLRSLFVAGVLLAGSPLVPLAAQADTTAAASAQAAGDTGDAAAGSKVDTSGQIEEIVVSARRRNETVQDTPVAITAVSTAQMESVASTNITDIQGMVPNLIMTQQATGGATLNMSLRGLSFADVEKSFDPTVAVVVDGAFVGTSTGQLLDFFDMSSIEVLRGPQGTLFGRNTIGGVINITRSRPTDDVSGKMEVDYSSYGTATERAVFSTPLKKGVLDAKVFFFHTKTDGYYRNYYTGESTGGGDNLNFGAAFLLTPTDNFNALLTLEEQQSEVDNVVSNIAKTGELFCTPGLFLTPAQAAVQCNRNTTTDLYQTFGPLNHDHYNSPAATLEMNWDTGFTHLVSISNYRSSAETSVENVGATDPVIYSADRQQSYWQASQELRASGNFTPTFDYVTGVYFFHSNYTLEQHTGGELFYTAPGETIGQSYYESQLTTGMANSEAVFADFDWEFVPKWRLNFGGRLTDDKKGLVTSAPYDGVFTNFGYHTDSWTKFTPKVSVDYRPTDDHMLYASWSQGFRSGGFCGRCLSNALEASTPFNPETVNAYELGAKTSWFDRRLLFNVALFYTDYKNIQETITEAGGSTGNSTVVKNAASAKVKGVEVDWTAKPFDPVTVRGSFGYLNAHFSGFYNAEAWSTAPAGAACTPTTCGLHIYDYSDVDLIYAPAFTGSFSVDYSIPVSYGKYSTTVGYRYIAPYDQQIARDDAVPVPDNDGTTVVPYNDPRVRTNVQNLLDASISLAVPAGHGETEFAVYGRNLADNRGAASAFTVAGLWSFATAREPRIFGVRAGYKF
jgi:iron complex outermembrane recepter protein